MQVNRNAQSAFEHLVILALILIFVGFTATLVISNTGDDQRVIGDTTTTQRLTGLVIDQVTVSPLGTYLPLTNKFSKSIVLNNMSINGIAVNSSQLPLFLSAYKQELFIAYDFYSNVSAGYDYTIVFNYTHSDGVIESSEERVTGTSSLIDTSFYELHLDEPLAKDTILYAPFNGASNDSSGYQHVSNGAASLYTSSHINEYAHWSPTITTNYTIGSTQTHQGDFSISLWYDDSTLVDGNYSIINTDEIFEIKYYVDANILAPQNDDEIIHVEKFKTNEVGGDAALHRISYSPPSTDFNNLSHFVYVFDVYNQTLASHSLYYNGVLQISETFTYDAMNNLTNTWFEIGSPASYTSMADELIVWTRVLDQSEISALYRRGDLASS